MNFIRKIIISACIAFSIQMNISNACDAVTGLHANSLTHSSATLNWDTTVSDSFLVRYFIIGSSELHFKLVNQGTATSLNIDSLYPNTTYGWLIHTYCNGGQPGPYQLSPSTFTTLSGSVSCYKPNLLFARNITNHTANVGWNQLVDADTFLVRYHVAGTSAYQWKYVSGMYHSATISGLSSSSIYEWNVRSVCNGNVFTASATHTFVTNCDTLPVPDHIVICIMENKGYPQIIDSFAIAPYINSLANDPMGALFTQSYGLDRPSQPNYLDLFSGSNQGITSNSLPPSHFTTPNLARELLDIGKTFVTYSENLPYTGSDTVRNGDYERKHNPVANWMGTGINQVPDTCNQPFTNFPTDYNLLPTVSYVVPDQANDMHNGTINVGDTWVANNMDAYVQWAKTNNSLFILTFDEDNRAYNNHIVTIFIGPMVRGGQYSKYMNHFSLLRTIEDIYNTGHAGHSGEIESVKECWNSFITGTGSIDPVDLDWAVYGFAGTGELNVDYSLVSSATIKIRVYNEEGKKLYDEPGSRQNSGMHRVIINPSNHHLAGGLYIVQLMVDEKVFSKKTIMVY